MKININGQLLADDSLNYEKLHQAIENNTYNGIGDAISGHIQNAINHTEWHQFNPHQFDLVKDFNHVQAICGENPACYMDSFNWAIMNKSELTADIYKFIANRASVIRDGLQNNLIPHQHLDFGGIFNLIDWHFVLDCISWFF